MLVTSLMVLYPSSEHSLGLDAEPDVIQDYCGVLIQVLMRENLSVGSLEAVLWLLGGILGQCSNSLGCSESLFPEACFPKA